MVESRPCSVAVRPPTAVQYKRADAICTLHDRFKGIFLSAGASVAAPVMPSDIQATFFNGQPFKAVEPYEAGFAQPEMMIEIQCVAVIA